MPAWGSKTSALFAKTIYQIHHLPQYRKYKIWDDTPELDIRNDKMVLPVDKVIINVFKKLEPHSNWNFKRINSLLSERFNPKQIEIWDDLWFWGFVTQKGSGYNGEYVWNPNKYWSLSASEKSSSKVKKIESKSKIFLKLLK